MISNCGMKSKGLGSLGLELKPESLALVIISHSNPPYFNHLLEAHFWEIIISSKIVRNPDFSKLLTVFLNVRDLDCELSLALMCLGVKRQN